MNTKYGDEIDDLNKLLYDPYGLFNSDGVSVGTKEGDKQLYKDFYNSQQSSKIDNNGFYQTTGGQKTDKKDHS